MRSCRIYDVAPTVVLLAALHGARAAHDLLVVENGLKPWPSGHGETPPPLGSLVRVDAASGERHVLSTGLVDPVWVAGSQDGAYAYVGLFHPGEIVRVSIQNGSTVTVAKNLSCPEGIALDARGYLYTVENPVGNECKQPIRKKAAQLTRIDLCTGTHTKVAALRSSTDGNEGGPHGLAIEGDDAYVCECPAGAASVTKVNLLNGNKSQIVPMQSPSGCAVGGGFVWAVEQGNTNGRLVRIELKAANKTTLVTDLDGPMGIAADVRHTCAASGQPARSQVCGFIYVASRHSNEVIRYNARNGETSIFADSDKLPFNSPIGLGVMGADP